MRLIAAYLGLGDEEPDKDEHGQAEAGEGDEGAVAALAHGDEHVGDCAGDDEVEQPLGGGAEGDVQAAEAGGRDLGDVDPADLWKLSAGIRLRPVSSRILTGPQPHWKKEAKR